MSRTTTDLDVSDQREECASGSLRPGRAELGPYGIESPHIIERPGTSSNARRGGARLRPTMPPRPPAIHRSLTVAIAGLALALAAGTALHAADSPVTGTYLGNGKAAKLAYVRILKADPWQGEPSYTLVISEKDASKIAKPDMDALFGKLGDALIINVTQSGALFGTQVCHQALEKAGFSTSGSIKVEGFSIKDGTLSGRFYTEGEEEFFGETWQVDLTVSGKVP